MNTTSLNWELTQDNDRITLHLIGELSRNTLLPLWEQRGSLFSGNSTNLVCDLSQIKRIDSAGFALLCNLVNDAKVRSNSVVFLRSVPHQLITLADLFGLSDWLAPHIQHGNS
ncbi:STAS domain-containing protein [[Haemophilus] felis]|uniref:STAS domain-containing protein n=1 Tax=[Haemophilus] felis TaxID=123822 RepID=A0A1T0AXJ8_9PAST|nr:STAS domain-containing protein [[Haemophilus] felis]NBI40509.1 STAS domain-containing protein [[Haemophilus] felis]OOS02522.1 hypothetical protein B0188_08350 [[Haemophilus] felis]